MSSHSSTTHSSRIVRVSAPSRAYEVVVGDGVLSTVAGRSRAIVGPFDRTLLVIDDGVPRALIADLTTRLTQAGVNVSSITITPSERDKSLGTVANILHAALEAGLDRLHPIISIGGGIVGDLAGFAASAYRRGVPWIHCPTTLLSMVDASVGGKTGVNLAAREGGVRKNMAGAFWQPMLVVADVAALASLSPRTFRCGLAECVKHGLLAGSFGDEHLGVWLDTNMERATKGDRATLIELAARNISVKARVVEVDEREEMGADASGRMLLNLGHTFGHAIETLPALRAEGVPEGAPLEHGEAVSLGLVAACVLSQRLGRGAASLLSSTRAMLDRAGLPTRVQGLPPNADILSRMRDDKKVASGRLRMIVPVGNAHCEVVVDPPPAELFAAIDAIRA